MKSEDTISKTNLNIAMLGHKRIPSREGGVEIVVEELSTRMAKQGHNVTCFNRSGHHVSGKEFDSKSQSEYKGVKLKSVFTLNKKGLAAMTSSVFAALRAALGKYDVVHFHAEGPCAMLWLPKLFGKRCIATIHGIDWQREKWKNGFGSKYIKFGEKMAVKYADEIIVLSKGVQDYFDKTYGRRTVFIPNGVSRPEVYDSEQIKEKYGLDKDDYILYLGRLVPEKGEHYLVEAFKMYIPIRNWLLLVVHQIPMNIWKSLRNWLLKMSASSSQDLFREGYLKNCIATHMHIVCLVI